MVHAALVLMSVAFVELIRVLRLQEQVRATVRISRASLEVVRSTTMSDYEKELASRRSSVALIRQTGMFAGKLTVALLGPVAIYVAALLTPGVDRARLDARLTSPVVWLGMTVLALIYLGIRRVVARRL